MKKPNLEPGLFYSTCSMLSIVYHMLGDGCHVHGRNTGEIMILPSRNLKPKCVVLNVLFQDNSLGSFNITGNFLEMQTVGLPLIYWIRQSGGEPCNLCFHKPSKWFWCSKVETTELHHCGQWLDTSRRSRERPPYSLLWAHRCLNSFSQWVKSGRQNSAHHYHLLV